MNARPRGNTRLATALLFLSACGTNRINVGTVPRDGGPDVHGTGVLDPLGDYGSTEIDKTVVPVACDRSNNSVALALFKYAPGYQPDPAVRETAQATAATMPIDDEALQMSGMPPYLSKSASPMTGTQMTDVYRGQDIETIRGFRYRDGSRGMNLTEDVDGVTPNAGTVNESKVGYSTAFPVSVARGAAFDLDLEWAIGEAIGDELQAAKQTILLAPSLNLMRHPLWGRAQEMYGEDSFHLGRLASAMAVGVQQHVAATAKHYMGYNIEEGRDFNNVTMDEQTLRESYGRHFRMVVQDGGVAAVMASYNLVNGVKSSENHHTLTDVLRTDFGFQGFVVSDWWAMNPQVQVDTDVMTLERYAVSAVEAGLDVEMPWSLNFAHLKEIVASKAVPVGDIDRSVTRILEQKFRFNADSFDQVGLGTPKTTYKDGRIGNDGEHLELALRAALEGMVLLKNDNGTLPIDPTVNKVAVLGATVPYRSRNRGAVVNNKLNFATDVLTGSLGSSWAAHDPAKGIGPLAGLRNWAPSGVTVVQGSNAADAKEADFVVVIAGLTPEDEGEKHTLAGDRMSLALDAKQTDAQYQNIQNNLITSVAALGKPMVVVLEGGSVIDMPWLDKVPAVVMAWYPGMVGGDAMGMLLWGWGQANFSGKLPITWGQLSDYPEFRGTSGTTSLGYYVGYRYFDQNAIVPIYPFGHGLSYTSFEYRRLQLGCSEMSEGAVLPVVVNVANTGTAVGDEIVMVFVSFPDSRAQRRSIKELKGFQRVRLKPGDEKQLTIPIRLQDLDYFETDPSDPTTGRWVVESGAINVMVGGSSTNLPLQAQVMVHGY